MGRRWLGMREDMGVRNDSHLFSGRHGVKAEAVGPRAFSECSKGCCIHLHAPPPILSYHAFYSVGCGKQYAKWVARLSWAY
jgi:hypothetical protein